MKIALVLPTWIYADARRALADACFASLLRTVLPAITPQLLLLVKPTEYVYPVAALQDKFWTLVLPQQANGVVFEGSDQPMVYGCERAFEHGADLVVQLGDDTLFHQGWLQELLTLVGRRPQAVAWSVYRSAHVAVHVPLREENGDVLVRSINGNGLAISREEWGRWGLNWRDKVWASPNGITLDMHHLSNRPGERWVTSRSFLEHAGRDGTHCKPGIPEFAIDFVGVGT